MANMRVDGETEFGSQQQWFTRSTDMKPTDPAVMAGAWSLVFLGTRGGPYNRDPTGHDDSIAFTNVALVPYVAEKPYITIEDDGTYSLQIPPMKWNQVGHNHEQNLGNGGRSVPFDQVYVASSSSDTAKSIQ